VSVLPSSPHEDTTEERDTLVELTEKYAPLLEWLKVEAGDNVKDGEWSLNDYTRIWSDVTYSCCL
jgi:hypothetical protein